ncbi:protodermal factor 1 [Cornus florida]|uniref:protodermal factor 1 n=1 Tax=Cornus florida TaxID=4283 RepID=UPI002899929C|nr:protodermal factor 1 [Cornus florida]
MTRERNKQASSLLMWALFAGLLSHNLLIPVMSTTTIVEDQKNYYTTPDPGSGTPPTSSHTSPPHGTPPSPSSGGSYTPPSHPTPSHGGYGSTPPPSGGGNCGTPPSGGHHHDPTPTPPSGGGYYNSPPTSGGSVPPTIVTPPSILTPPPTPFFDPGTRTPPGISPPTPPFDPNSPPFTCNYWRTHPGLIWGILGWWGTLGSAFGMPSIPGLGNNMSLQQALSNTRTDGFGALYREGTASLLNSMVNKRFPFTTKQVRENFVTAVSSNKAAAAQAQLFKLANEGRLKPRA